MREQTESPACPFLYYTIDLLAKMTEEIKEIQCERGSEKVIDKLIKEIMI